MSNSDGKQNLTILIKVEERDEWEEWMVCGVYVLDEETGKAYHLGGQKVPVPGDKESRVKAFNDSQ